MYSHRSWNVPAAICRRHMRIRLYLRYFGIKAPCFIRLSDPGALWSSYFRVGSGEIIRDGDVMLLGEDFLLFWFNSVHGLRLFV